MRLARSHLPAGLALLQIVDAAGGELVPRRWVTAHLDHLGVPRRLQPLLPMVKVVSSAGLLLGMDRPRLAVVTSAALVGYYASAVTFHLQAPEHPALAVPAGFYGVVAAVTFLESSRHRGPTKGSNGRRPLDR